MEEVDDVAEFDLALVILPYLLVEHESAIRRKVVQKHLLAFLVEHQLTVDATEPLVIDHEIALLCVAADLY